MINLIERTGNGTIERLRPTIAKWIKLADLKIGTPYQFERKNIVIDLDGNEGTLPNDWALIEYIILGDHSDNIYNYYNLFPNIIQTEMSNNLAGAEPLVFYWSSGQFEFNYINWEVQGDKIIFPYNYLTETQATIVYLGYKTDTMGLPMIRETHLEAVTKYCESHLIEKEKWKYLAAGDSLGASRVKQLAKQEMDEYHRFVRQARAEDSRTNTQENNRISIMYNNPYSGRNNFILG